MSRRPLRIVVPIKGGDAAKSRLAPVLAAERRRELAAAMYRHVVAVALSGPPPLQVVAVTACPTAAGEVAAMGADVVPDRIGGGTADACRQGVAGIDAGVDVLFLNADLPLLGRDALHSLLHRRDRVVIAPDRRRVGTNALFVPAGARVTPSFGPASFSRHLALAAVLDAAPAIFDDPATACDIDEPDDLEGLGCWAGRNWIEGREPAL